MTIRVGMWVRVLDGPEDYAGRRVYRQYFSGRRQVVSVEPDYVYFRCIDGQPSSAEVMAIKRFHELTQQGIIVSHYPEALQLPEGM